MSAGGDKPLPSLASGASTASKAFLEGFISKVVDLMDREGVDSALLDSLGKAATTHVQVQHASGSSRPSLPPAAAEQSAPALRLMLRHDCNAIGCADAGCPLCRNNHSRRCPEDSHFATKCIEGDSLRAYCGAPVYLQLEEAATGRQVDANLEATLTLVDADQYTRWLEACTASAGLCEAASPVLTLNRRGLPLLVMSSASHDEHHSIVVRLNNGRARLAGLVVTDSGAALSAVANKANGGGASGPKITAISFRLLAVAAAEAALPVALRGATVQHLLSEPFQILSKRSKSNLKPARPHVRDMVTALDGIGNATGKKLLDLAACAAARGYHSLLLPPAVSTVGEFAELARTAANDYNLELKLRKLLGLTEEQWLAACEHARRAVQTDHTPRVWYSNADHTEGLAFECLQGNVMLHKPIGLVTPKGLQLDSSLANSPALRVQLKAAISALLPLAQADWYAEGHANWAIYSGAQPPNAAAEGSSMGARASAPAEELRSGFAATSAGEEAGWAPRTSSMQQWGTQLQVQMRTSGSGSGLLQVGHLLADNRQQLAQSSSMPPHGHRMSDGSQQLPCGGSLSLPGQRASDGSQRAWLGGGSLPPLSYQPSDRSHSMSSNLYCDRDVPGAGANPYSHLSIEAVTARLHSDEPVNANSGVGSPVAAFGSSVGEAGGGADRAAGSAGLKRARSGELRELSLPAKAPQATAVMAALSRAAGLAAGGTAVPRGASMPSQRMAASEGAAGAPPAGHAAAVTAPSRPTPASSASVAAATATACAAAEACGSGLQGEKLPAP